MKIHKTVRKNKKAYGPGSERVLAGLLSNEEIERLTAADVISGFPLKKAKPAEPPEKPETQNPETLTPPPLGSGEGPKNSPPWGGAK